MTKRAANKFSRNPRDFYPTPAKAIQPLIPHLPPMTIYDEPFAGDGAMVRALSAHGHICGFASDITPLGLGINKWDYAQRFHCGGSVFISNPPWRRDLLHPAIEHLTRIAPVWFLFDSDWKHTVQATPYLAYCRKIVSVGRVSWMANGASGFDNCSWYYFDRNGQGGPVFYGRV